MSVRAVWNGKVIAETDQAITVEGNYYFPMDSIVDGVLEPSRARSLCPWKGIASYFDVVVDGVRCPGAAWCYRHPTPFARRVKNRVAFWRGVEVTVVSPTDSSFVPVQREHVGR